MQIINSLIGILIKDQIKLKSLKIKDWPCDSVMALPLSSDQKKLITKLTIDPMHENMISLIGFFENLIELNISFHDYCDVEGAIPLINDHKKLVRCRLYKYTWQKGQLIQVKI